MESAGTSSTSTDSPVPAGSDLPSPSEKRDPLPPGHPPVAIGKVGVLLVNLGTPDGYDRRSMRRYLKEFLSDPRVIEVPRLIWYPILHGIILNLRPARSGKLYASIWNETLDESPLRTHTRDQGEGLARRLAGHDNLVVEWAMRYGKPGIPQRIDELQARGCDRILVVPLYPQYSASTTASVNDKVFQTLQGKRWTPALRTAPPFHDEPSYIDALAVSLERSLGNLDFVPERVIASYHGIPAEYFEKGDPYHCHCHKTSRLLQERLGWPDGRLMTCFQSRFGPREWLQPYTDKTLEQLAGDGFRDVAVFNPGFVSDCLETLEEIAMEGAKTFRDAGGQRFAHLPCLNASEECLDMLQSLVQRELSGWID